MWYDGEEKCQLYGQELTLSHTLSGRKVALSQGRYKYRHDKVMKELANSIQSKINVNVKVENTQRRKINFVKEGAKR